MLQATSHLKPLHLMCHTLPRIAGAFDEERCGRAAEHLAAVTKRFQDPESMKVSDTITRIRKTARAAYSE